MKQFEQIRNYQTNSQIYHDFDITSVLRDAVGAYSWKDKNGFWTAISGISNQYSKQIYSNIQLLTQKLVDIETCNTHALKSLAQSVNAQHITNFIVQDYPIELQKLIDLFSVPKHILFSSNQFISKYAKEDINGTIDIRNKDIYNNKYGYSQLIFNEILQKLDQIRYLLQVQNEINFNLSIWNYIDVKHIDYKYISLSGLIQKKINNQQINLEDKNISYSAPSLNKIFAQLQYLRNNYQNNYNISIQKKQEKNILHNMYDLFYQQNYNNSYLVDTEHIILTKNKIIQLCSKINLYKDLQFLKQNNKEYIDNYNLNDVIFFGWSPYPNKVLNNEANYKLFNDLQIDKNTLFINPFLVLIAVLKNILYNTKTGKKLKLIYTDNKSKEIVDLSYLILNLVQSIQNDNNAYYIQLITYHFYGLFYDMIINDYLKKQWNIINNNGILKQIFVGNYKEYTKEEFIKNLPKSLKQDSLIQFFKSGIIYFNQYQLDFLKYLNIINNNLQQIDQKEQFPYIITYYNNDFQLSDYKSSYYNNEKRRLLGFQQNIIFKDLNINTNNNILLKLNINKSLLYKVALKFANYCNQIRLARESIKILIQNYAKIGSAKIIENIVKQYFYKEFINKSDWNMFYIDKNIDNLSTINLFKNISDYKNNKLEIQLVQYFDKTNYLNIYSQKPPILSGQNIVSTIITPQVITGYTPSTFYSQYTLTEDAVINSNNISGNIVLYNDKFNQIIDNIYPDIYAISSITKIQKSDNKFNIFYNVDLYNSNGFDEQLSANWKNIDIQVLSGINIINNNKQISSKLLNVETPVSTICNNDSYKDKKIKELLAIYNINNLQDVYAISSLTNIQIINNNFEISYLVYLYNTNGFEEQLSANWNKLTLPILSGTFSDDYYTNLINKLNLETQLSTICNNDIYKNKKVKDILLEQKIYNLQSIYPEVISISSTTLIKDQYEYNTNRRMLAYYYANLYITNNNQLSTKWKLIDNIPVISGMTYYNSDITGHIILSSILDSQQSLSSLYNNIYNTNNNIFNKKLKDILDENNEKLYIINKNTKVKKYYEEVIPYETINYVSSYITQPRYIKQEIFNEYNYKFWNIKDNISQDQILFWEKYFPNLKSCQTLSNKKIYFKQKIYPFICDILQMNTNGEFVGQLSGMQKQYIGINGNNDTLNITNIDFPTIAGIQKISNLIEKKDITNQHNAYVNLYLNTYYNDIKRYSQNMLGQLLNTVDTIDKTTYYKNINAWKYNYTTFVGYNTTYGQKIKIPDYKTQESKYYNVDGPWIYDSLVNFIKLYEKIETTYQLESLSSPISLNGDQPYSFYQYPVYTYKIKYFIQYNLIKQFVQSIYDNINNINEINQEILKLYVYQYDILRMQQYRIYDYKEDKFENSFTLFKYYKNNKYEDAGQIWIRKKDSHLSVPVMLYREINQNQTYIYDQYDTIVCKEHNTYANILKQLFNNAVQFGIYEDVIWILGYSNYIKQNNTFIKLKEKYLKLCIFNYKYDDIKNYYYVNINSLKFLTIDNLDFFKNINQFVCAYNNYNNKNIDFIIYNPQKINNVLIKKYNIAKANDYSIQQLNSYLNLNDVQLEFLKYSYNILNFQINNIDEIFMNHTKYPIIGMFNSQQLIDVELNKQYNDKNRSILYLIGYTVNLYKFNASEEKNIIDNYIIKIGQCIINYNNTYNCLQMIFSNVESEEINNNINNILLNNHNIISYYYDGRNTIFFENIQNIIINNYSDIFDNYIIINSTAANIPKYLIKIQKHNTCECNFKDISKKEISFVKSLINENVKYLSEKYNKNIIPLGITYENHISKIKNNLIFNSQNDVYLYIVYAKDDSNPYILKEYYCIYYLENNKIQYKILDERSYIHNKCYTYKEYKNQHIWKTNINKEDCYISYESINNNIENQADFYKNLYYNQADNIYIDTIVIEGTLHKKKIHNDIYVNVIDSIKISYNTEKIDLPFNFQQLSEYMISDDCYIVNEDDEVEITKDLNIDWINNYRIHLNAIHNNYPKCKIENNKIICTTILTQLGGIKNFKSDISSDISSLSFLINYIFNSSIRKKIYTDEKNKTKYVNDLLTEQIYRALLVTNSKYCINDFLYQIVNIKGFAGHTYLNYRLQEGFLDILDLYSVNLNINKNKDNLLINNVKIKEFIIEQYKKQYNQKLDSQILKAYNNTCNEIQKKIKSKLDLTEDDEEKLTLELVEDKIKNIRSYIDNYIKNDITKTQFSTLLKNQLNYIINNINNKTINDVKISLSNDKIEEIINQLHRQILNTNFIIDYKNDILNAETISFIYIIETQVNIKQQLNNNGLMYKLNELSNYQQENYLKFLKAIPAFSDCFTDNLKVYINFGQLSKQIKNFIIGSQSFDLDSSIYIDDSNYDNIQVLKKVGWRCGYNKTDYITSITNDNRFGGPEVYDINLAKYKNYLINKYVNVYENSLENYRQLNFNTIANNIKIHLEVCWYNQSILRSINPTIEIYWKGMYISDKVNKSKININSKCCQDSWSKDILIDLTNNIFKYSQGNALYPVFVTQLQKKYNYNILDNNNIIFRQELSQQTENDIKTINFSQFLQNYSNYRINDLEFNNYCIEKYEDITTLKNEFNNILLNSTNINDMQLLLNYLCVQLLVYLDNSFNKENIHEIIIKNIKSILPSSFNQLIDNNQILNENYYKTFKEIYKDNLSGCLNKFSQLFEDNDYINKLYIDFKNFRKEFNSIYSDKFKTEQLTILIYQHAMPKQFFQYYTNIENISSYLNKTKTNFYFPSLPMPLSGTNIGSLQAIYNQEQTISNKYTYIDNSDQYGFILLIQNNDINLTRRNIIVTDFNKLIKTNIISDLKINNYFNIKQIVDLYLKETLIIDSTSGLLNCYEQLNLNYIPDYNLLITPYISFYIQNKKLDLSKDKFKDLFKEDMYIFNNGYYFDMPENYNKVKYNCLTNNFIIDIKNNMNDFYLLSTTENINTFEITNTFEVLSQNILYKEFNEYYEQLGYDIELYNINEKTLIYQNSIKASKTENTEYQLSSFNEGDVKIQLPLMQNPGVLSLNIIPYFKINYTKYKLKGYNIVISNQYDLFSINMPIPSSSLDDNVSQYSLRRNNNQNILTNNIIPLVTVVTSEDQIFINLNDLITKNQVDKEIIFISNNIKKPLSMYYNIQDSVYITNTPLEFKMENGQVIQIDNNHNLQLDGFYYNISSMIKANTKYLSGIAKNVDNFDYEISAYQHINNELYYVGLILGKYIYKDLKINNIFKNDKKQFIFTTNMSEEEINSELLHENFVSSVIQIIPSTININNIDYLDIDFINYQIQDKLFLILNQQVINEK